MTLKLVTAITSVTIALLVLACGSDDNTNNSSGGSAGAGATGGAAGQGGSAQGGSAQGGSAQGGNGGSDSTLSASLSGKLQDGTGKALGGYRVQLCYHACRTADVQADGTYSHPKLEPATHLLEIWPGLTGPNADIVLAPSFPLTLADHEAKTLDLIWLAPDKKVNLPDTAKDIEIADGLFVKLGKDTAQASMFLTGDFTEVYGARYPDAKLPPVVGVSDPVAFWVLGPTDTSSKGDGFPIHFTNKWSLADGTKLHVWHAEQDETSMEGKWVSVGDVTVSGNDISGTAKLAKLGTVLLSK